MGEVVQLDYATAAPPQSPRVAAIIAFTLGICSGPLIVAAVCVSGLAYGISGIAGSCAVAVGVAIFGYCLWAYDRSAAQPRARGRVLALIGLLATALWSVGFVALFLYIDANLE